MKFKGKSVHFVQLIDSKNEFNWFCRQIEIICGQFCLLQFIALVFITCQMAVSESTKRNFAISLDAFVPFVVDSPTNEDKEKLYRRLHYYRKM